MESGQNEGSFMALGSVQLHDGKTEEVANETLVLSDDTLTVIATELPMSQVTEDKMQYLQVVNENNEVQLLQLSCSGSNATSLVQLLNGSDAGQQLVIQCQAFPLSPDITGNFSNTTESVVLSELQDGSFPLVQNKTGIQLQGNVDPTTQDQHQGEFVVDKNSQDDQETIGGLDLNRPITLTEDTIVIIDDEKCVLRMEPNTRSLVAYPLRDELSSETSKHRNNVIVKRKRGRPPKSVTKLPLSADLLDQSSNSSAVDSSKIFTDEKAEDSDEEKSGAAECLLGLADGRRKSSRVKKRPMQLMDYEVEQSENCSETPVQLKSCTTEVSVLAPYVQEMENDKTIEILPRPATSNQMQNFLANLGLPVKRGRGRPRRKPLPLSSDVQARLLPVLLPKLSPVVPPPVVKETAIIIQQEDGSEKHILVSSSIAAEQPLQFTSSLAPDVKPEIDETFPSADSDVDPLQREDEVLTLDGCGQIQVPSTMFQISNQVLPFATPKSEPVKIGPKMKEEELANLRCSKCDFQALYSHQFQQHIAEQHADESAELFKCKCCNFLSFTKESLTAHFRECHPKCICYICDFTAEHSYIVKRHMQRHDTTGCECSICGKKYKDQYILKMHFKMVHMPAEVLFQCQICCKEFTRKAHLKRHLRIHNPDKPFKCPHCEYRGCERSDINKHLLIHNEPKYSCEICLKTFRHIKNKELHVRRHQGQRDYTCGICGFLGYTFTDIRKHIERKHMELRNVCNRCGATFKTDALLREHFCDLILLEQALEADGTEVGEECYTNETIPLITEDQTLLSDPQQVIITSNSVSISLETLALPDESLQLIDNSMEHEQIIGEV